MLKCPVFAFQGRTFILPDILTAINIVNPVHTLSAANYLITAFVTRSHFSTLYVYDQAVS